MKSHWKVAFFLFSGWPYETAYILNTRKLKILEHLETAYIFNMRIVAGTSGPMKPLTLHHAWRCREF